MSSGIVHSVAPNITVFEPSQFAVSVMKLPNAFLKVIVKLISGEPLSVGAIHLTTTVLFLILVLGASGLSGLNALFIVTIFEV